jgi:quinol monooxygenase YgiN
MHARVNATEWDPEKAEEGIRLTKETIIPSYQEQPGFRGYFLLTEPGGERAMAITMWETEEDMEASAAVARAMIPKLKGILRAPPETRNYEVMFNVQP